MATIPEIEDSKSEQRECLCIITVHPPVRQRQTGWLLNGTQCYYFSPKRLQLTWNSSKEKCRSFSGDLIKIESTEEQEFLDGTVQHLMADRIDRFWIGLTDFETEGKWLWADGSPLDQSLQFWMKNEHNTEPDNWKEEDEDGENCATMGETDYINGIKSWYDVSCKKKMRFICKKRATRSAACG
ncbi:C-type lectin domain family 4 member E-like [Boleophthalmus pectinirostris]|uniref:C-type lectin domain family 4 member E-like n=1 Tax=Boleophthalmus pectinirostris TaxID=150288 RepID=UPI00242C907C|nr:C-type lectin domain family 4 member E-like [Boleophthalmus pectinirostris]